MINQSFFFKLEILVFIVVFFSSCTKKDTDPPVITFDASGGLVFKDTVFPAGTNFKVSLIAEMGGSNITNFVIKNYHDGQVTDYLYTGVNSETINITKILTKNVFDTEKWTFMVIDKNGKNASVSFNVYRDTSAGYQLVKVFPGVILGAQKNPAKGSFMSLKSGNTWFQPDAFNIQDSIELLYYFDSTGDANTIASAGANIATFIYPGSTSPLYWSIRHETRFYKTAYSNVDFNNVQNDSLLLVAYDEINGKRKAKNLAAGDVYSFKTAHARYGMFLVEQVLGADSGMVQFTIKIQK